MNYLERKEINVDCLREDLKVKDNVLLKKLLRLLKVQMMIKKYNQLIQ